jgi:arylsulfatase A-like enzyme
LGVAGFASGAVGVLWLAGWAGGGRVTDVGLTWLGRLFFLSQGWDPSYVAPRFLDRFWNLERPSQEIQFFLLAVGAQLAWTLLLGLILIPGLRILERSLIGKRLSWGCRLGYWLVPSFALALLLGSALLRPTLDLFRVYWPWDHWVRWGIGFTFPALVLLVWVLARAFRKTASVGSLNLVLGVGAVGMSFVILIRFLAGAALNDDSQIPRDSSPNILLISIDTLRSDHLSSYGYPFETSPCLDALASEGTRFETVVAPSSWTVPSHITLLTALPPRMHQVISHQTRLSRKAVTLAEILHRAGYDTAAFVGSPTLRADYGYWQGFDLYDDYTVATTNEEITSPRLLRLTTDWLRQWTREGRSRPFFLFLHLWDVHGDYTPPAPYDTLFDPDYKGPVTGELDSPVVRKGMSEQDLRHLVALYDGEIRYVDQHLGDLFEFLKTENLFDTTVLAVTSDHGEEFLEHGNFRHHRTLYDEVVLVPLIIRYPPGVPAGCEVERQARLMDVAPTLLALAGIETGEAADLPGETPHRARSLVPLMDGNSPEGQVDLPAFGDLDGVLHSLRTPFRKLILNRLKGATEVFDLTTDPGERVNLGIHDGSGEQILLDELERWLALAPDEELTVPVMPDQEQLDRLRALGYIQ